MVRYVRCTRCGFIFTSHCDTWPPDRMRDRIYNADYPRADPGFAEARPAGFARALSGWLAPLKSRIASLDHGGGSGRLAALMRQAGFDYDTYDPYFAGSAAPRRRYDLVTSFEVVEHTPDPVATFTTMLSFLQPEGAVLFSTNLQPPLVTSDWWYIAPRNGHVSIYTARSLRALAARLGVGFLTLGTHLHLLYRSAGDPVAGTLLRHDLFSVLWQASQQNARALAAATWTGLQLGRPFTALDPRHAARLLLGERKPAASR